MKRHVGPNFSISLPVDVRRVMISVVFLFFSGITRTRTNFVYQLKVRNICGRDVVDGLLERYFKWPGPQGARISISELVGTLGGPEVGRERFFQPVITRITHKFTEGYI